MSKVKIQEIGLLMLLSSSAQLKDLPVIPMLRLRLINMLQRLKLLHIKELYVRYILILESKKMAKYNAALKKSSSISFD